MNLKYEKIIDGITYSTDKTRLDINYIHTFLAQHSYWAQGIPYSIVKRSIDHSLCFGIYKEQKQIGFARFITDYATFGYLADVFVDEQFRGQGLSKSLIRFIFTLEELRMLRRMILVTRDAHKLYEREGFQPLATPDFYMEFRRQDVYKTFMHRL